ncbi:hypothetical protein H3N91_003534 [Salmonella enterica]|nr:hypothetical protein [Salmonella enterica]EEA2274497.1 hypothetical protein [Salmonella enterica]EFV5118018.1 hypothetical protein [Salmonella enterica]EGB7057964.1 hypothetical protein [Salmonella enterica]EKL9527489.1 hypothetical protein [Salmonella enterica]
MKTYPIRQEWLTLEEAADVLKQHDITLLPADLFRHALHKNLTLSVWFQSSVLLRPLTPTCQFACINNEGEFCRPSRRQKIMPLSRPERQGPQIRETCCTLWDLPLIGLERLLIQQKMAHSLVCPCPQRGHCCREAGIVVHNPEGRYYQLCERKPLREIALELIEQRGKLPTPFHQFMARLYRRHPASLPARLRMPFCYPSASLPEDTLLVIRKTQLEAFLKQHLPEGKPRVTTALSRLLWLACKKNPQLDDELLAHPYKLLNIFESWAQEEGLRVSLNGDTLKSALSRGAPD